MIEVTRETTAPPQDVWDVLSDGWLYSMWVVGASRIREVEAAWPAVGSRIHHSAGVWPLVVDDTSVVLELEHERRLVLQARGWPFGEARVELHLRPLPGGGTHVRISEDASVGPGRWVPEPLRRAALVPRNRESLWRLAILAEGRAGAHVRGQGEREPSPDS